MQTLLEGYQCQSCQLRPSLDLRQVVAIQRSYSNLHFMRAIGASPPQPSKAAENDRADTKQHQGRRFGNNVDGARISPPVN